jgi:hypothetical protein
MWEGTQTFTGPVGMSSLPLDSTMEGAFLLGSTTQY